MRGQLGNINFFRVVFDNVPNRPLRDTVAPTFAGATHAPEQTARRDCGGRNPQIDGRFDPVRNGYCSDVATLTDEVDERPMFLTTLQMFDFQIREFAAA
jgi:hypothetical protein